MMFPDRAPSDQYLYTTFVGGSRNKDLAGASVYVLFYFILILDLHSEMEKWVKLHSSTENLSFFPYTCIVTSWKKLWPRIWGSCWVQMGNQPLWSKCTCPFFFTFVLNISYVSHLNFQDNYTFDALRIFLYTKLQAYLLGKCFSIIWPWLSLSHWSYRKDGG